ncbi:glycosyltransferase family 2 protein [Phaeobacter porticola]|uniref:Glycosyltransferase involved in cell wall biogenesis n=1 Tax=Phaeobacter porticola TaxID=1844006 RepID=A0A1L3I9S3_9RHOB|nr:glycosyltransferase family 2 protein [Phaeobacter porticola]APG48917.1 Glycosyltransferase involved in cell wall biogenesis [Phaeobacter porticola]
MTSAKRPMISVIMANRNAAAHLPLAIRAILAQSLTDLELIIIDDASQDNSWDVIAAAATADPRVLAQRRETPGGPAVARNQALAMARGEWLAICDSDDSQHPHRLEAMLAAAEDLGADLVADDLILFSDQPMARAETILGSHAPQAPRLLTLRDVMLSGVDPKGITHIGYLKPLIRNRFLGDHRYDTSLRIGEDHDLYLRLVLAGAQMWVLPMAAYLYRRHPASISYRNVPRDLTAQIQALDALAARVNNDDMPSLAAVRRQALRRRHAQLKFAKDVREDRLMAALIRGLRRPDFLPWLVSVLCNRLEQRMQAAMSRLWRRPEHWQLNADDADRADDITIPVGAAGEVDLSAKAAPRWARLCAEVSRREIHLQVSGSLGTSAVWMLPGASVTISGEAAVATETGVRSTNSPESGLVDRKGVAVSEPLDPRSGIGSWATTGERDDTDG